MKYNDITFGQTEAVFNKLGGVSGVTDFLSGKTKVVNSTTGSDVSPAFLVWKTIKIGTFRNVSMLMSALCSYEVRFEGYLLRIKKNFHVDDFAKGIISKKSFSLSSKEVTLTLVLATPKSLGFTSVPTYEEICKRAIYLGLELCPLEVGPQLRLQYKDQQKGEGLSVALVENDDRAIFSVGHFGGELRLSCYDGNPKMEWPLMDKFVFCLPSKIRQQSSHL